MLLCMAGQNAGWRQHDGKSKHVQIQSLPDPPPLFSSPPLPLVLLAFLLLHPIPDYFYCRAPSFASCRQPECSTKMQQSAPHARTVLYFADQSFTPKGALQGKFREVPCKTTGFRTRLCSCNFSMFVISHFRRPSVAQFTDWEDLNKN